MFFCLLVAYATILLCKDPVLTKTPPFTLVVF